MYFKPREHVLVTAIQITAAAYNGQCWDGSPFNPHTDDEEELAKVKKFLETLMELQKLSVAKNRSRESDYAVWRLIDQDGDETLLYPGDWIVLFETSEFYAFKDKAFDLLFRQDIPEDTPL